jgi:Ribonuclease G/E
MHHSARLWLTTKKPLKISGPSSIDIAPEKQKIVKLYNNKIPIFDHFGIEKQIKTRSAKLCTAKARSVSDN